jgi:hypothetical protein
MASTSWTRVSVVRVRRSDLQIGAAKALRPGKRQLVSAEHMKEREIYHAVSLHFEGS